MRLLDIVSGYLVSTWLGYQHNGTVSVRDTVLSLHTPWGVIWTNSSPNSLILAKFSFGGGGYSGHHIPQILAWGHSRNFEHKIFTAQAGSCITDSLSHNTCVETKLGYQPNMYAEKQIRFGTMFDATHTNNFHRNNFHFALFKFKVVSLCSSLNLNLKKKLHLLTRFLL